jgi:hypothetical protein
MPSEGQSRANADTRFVPVAAARLFRCRLLGAAAARRRSVLTPALPLSHSSLHPHTLQLAFARVHALFALYLGLCAPTSSLFCAPAARRLLPSLRTAAPLPRTRPLLHARAMQLATRALLALLGAAAVAAQGE